MTTCLYSHNSNICVFSPSFPSSGSTAPEACAVHCVNFRHGPGIPSGLIFIATMMMSSQPAVSLPAPPAHLSATLKSSPSTINCSILKIRSQNLTR